MERQKPERESLSPEERLSDFPLNKRQKETAGQKRVLSKISENSIPAKLYHPSEKGARPEKSECPPPVPQGPSRGRPKKPEPKRLDHSIQTRNIMIQTEYIQLSGLLKYSGVCLSGGEARQIIKEGKVRVNLEVCTQVGKKLRHGDVVSVDGHYFRVNRV